jgi:outer membrane murein-binding lipoprotein Lpp
MRFLLCFAVLFAGVSLMGCEKEAKVKKTVTATSPEGSTTKTTETTLESKGKNPPTVDGQAVPNP